ncbi:MAG: hypothetical protein K6F74_05875 [Prevotella sp.]|nr:hypothetical protein [Prevotella sp.]
MQIRHQSLILMFAKGPVCLPLDTEWPPADGLWHFSPERLQLPDVHVRHIRLGELDLERLLVDYHP